MTLSWSSHTHRCACGRRWDCADPSCEMTLPDMCGECESARQYDFFCAREAEKTARRIPETDSTRQTAQEF